MVKLTLLVMILTRRLTLVSGGASIWHLQVGLTAAAVLDGLLGLSCGGSRGACEVGKTATQLFYNSSTGGDQLKPNKYVGSWSFSACSVYLHSSPRWSACRGRGLAASDEAAAGG